MPEATLRTENDQRAKLVDHQSAARELQDLLPLRLPAFYRCAFRLLGNAADAEDAVQEALLAAYKHISEFRGQAQFSTWLTTIVRNCALMQLRKRPRQIHYLLDEQFGEEQPRALWEGLADERPSPEEEFRYSELTARYENAQHCCRRPCEGHFSCVSWTVSQSMRQPESWECHMEQSKLSWHAREQKLRGICGQCLREALVN